MEFAYQMPDEETVEEVVDVLEQDGRCVGASTGVNPVGAVRLASERGPGHTIVTLLTDSGLPYQSRLFNPAFLRSRDLPVPRWLARARGTMPAGTII